MFPLCKWNPPPLISDVSQESDHLGVVCRWGISLQRISKAPIDHLALKELLSFVEKESFFQFSPVDIFKESLNIISPLQAIVDHEGVFKDIHD
jgi:hypothetical protein